MIRAAMRSLLLAVAAVVCVATSAAAHGAGTSQVTLRLDGARIEGEWEIHLRDARWALGRDTTQVGEGALRDLRAHEPELRALLMRTLALAGDSLACPLELTAAPLEWLPRFEEVRFHLIARCPNEPTRLRIGNEWMFDLDPTHRAYFSVVDARATSVGVLRATLRSVTFTVRQFHFGQIASEFLLDGVRHLWLRLDYVLFLLALLMPTVLIREGGAWRPRPGIAAAVRVAAPLLAAFA
ncbi:MAG: hypothetical protein HOP12_08610, partial [Candidatus Eisenbacteria bacterium]|nr:hypothetical protein [Candidatus Eisenbacteria bacterium]